MAVDTRAKRFSMLYAASPGVWSPHFEADGTVDADDRAQLLHLYGGISLESAAAGGSGGGSSKKRRPQLTRAQREERELFELVTIITAWMN